MVLSVSSPKSGNLSASDYATDPDKEISDDEDDDRNHKHRRREMHDKDAVESISASARSITKQNGTFENGHGVREGESHNSQSWNNYNSAPSDKHFSGKFGKRPLDVNHRNRPNHLYSGSGDLAFGRGRGRDSAAWNHRNNRFKSLDLSSQVLPRGPIPPALFPERGLTSVPNAQGAPWGGYPIHSIGLQGAFGPPISSSLVIPRQRCRDFEERGFCLRGDMCPMEHGINRIVVEDVQSLSQFNLPMSLPSGSMLGPPAVPGPLPSVGAATSSIVNSKVAYGRNGKHGMVDDNMALKAPYLGPSHATGADLYDPDQPLWNNNGLRSSPVDETASLSNDDASDNLMNEVTAFERRDRTTLPVGSQGSGSSIWGRIKTSKGRNTSKLGISDNVHDEMLENQEALGNDSGSSNHGKRIMAEDNDPKASDSTRIQIDAMRLTRKPSQKAQRTLFVNGIPQKNNRRDALLGHFQKFGKVIDIYIPINSERAFVQFSRREEAEAALRAPDAVMGNRFIKLFWANRDSIADDGTSGIGGVSSTANGTAFGSALPALTIPTRGKENLQSAYRAGSIPPRDAFASQLDNSKPSVSSSPKIPSPLQKKLEQFKEELRKKQEMLDRKRTDFKRKLDKLAKQATSVKDEDLGEEATKRQKVEMISDPNTACQTQSPDTDAVATSCEDKVDEKTKLPENLVPGKPDKNSLISSTESVSLKRQSHPLAHLGMPFSPNRYKLDNRPTTFRIIPPLPPGLAEVAALKEHFSPFGDLTVVELEDTEANAGPVGTGTGTVKRCSARIGYRDRQTAEKAFLNCKSWKGHYLQFVWVASATPLKATINPSGSDFSSATKEPVDSDVQASEEVGQKSSGESAHSERESLDHGAKPAEVSQSATASESN